jgi:alpha-beta hydrolase superfamily lysophospholipase
MRILRRLCFALAAGYAVFCVLGGVVLAELSLRLPRLALGDTSVRRAELESRWGGRVQEVEIAAADGVPLRAWWVVPAGAGGGAVMVLHGVTANRVSSTGYAQMFLARGYAVLMPDSRRHGASGGQVATYGVLEREDVARWVAWMRVRQPGCAYLLGESMGAAIALQAEAVAPGVCAVAMESPYAQFREISYERLGRESRLGAAFWHTAGAPILEIAILWTRLRYGVWLPSASPLAGVEASKVPTLLIGDADDLSIPVHHQRELYAACRSHCELWVVPGAGHGGASSVAHQEFERRVVAWFAGHPGGG